MFQLTLPRSDRHTQVQIVVRHDGGMMDYTFDDSHKVMDLHLPEGVGIGDVEISAQFLDRHGNHDPACGPMILKDKVPSGDPKQSCEPTAPVEPTDGPVADAGDEAATNPGGEGADDAEQVGGSDVKQEANANAEPSKEEVTTLAFNVPDMPATPSEGPKVHHRPRVPSHK